MSDLLERTEKLIQEANALLKKAQESIEESEAFCRSLGVDDPAGAYAALVKQADPAQVKEAERIAMEQLEALAQQRKAERAFTPPPTEPGEVPARRRKFRRMV